MTVRDEINEVAWLLALIVWVALWIVIPLPVEAGAAGVVAWLFRMVVASRR